MGRVAILGLGLMGGSLGLALRRGGAAPRVYGYARREETRRQALARGVADRVFEDPAEAVRGVETAVLCVPVLAIPELARRCTGAFDRGCVVTDVGSTKAELVREMDRVLRDSPAEFVGSHPIAGSEASGIEASRADLYEGAVVVVTPSPGREHAAARVVSLWESVGARTVILEAGEHDRCIARTSHLPHLVAAMLVSSVDRDGCETVRDLLGKGFRDTTRIAGGSEEIWHDVVRSNRAAVRDELEAFGAVLDRVRRMIEQEDFEGIRAFLAEAGKRRRELNGTGERSSA